VRSPRQPKAAFKTLTLRPRCLFHPTVSTVQFAPAFPGWTGTIGGSQATYALYNDAYLSVSAISIIDSGWPYTYLGRVIQGNYTAVLQAGVIYTSPTTTEPADVTLSQTGRVPLGMKSLQFEASFSGSLTPATALVVTLGGQRLSYIPLGSGANYTLYGADIHAFAGLPAELDFTLPSPGLSGNNYVFLDAIQFSGLPVPEPGVLGLWALGAVLLGWRNLGQRR
jgi:hypothetical protein